MAGLDCATAGACATVITNAAVLFSDNVGGFDVADSCSLPSYASITRSPQIVEATEVRFGGRQGCGMRSPVGEDDLKTNWVVSVPWCTTDPFEAYLQHGECWHFRLYPDLCEPLIYYDLTGRVSLDQDVVYDNDTQDDVRIQFTIKGDGPDTPSAALTAQSTRKCTPGTTDQLECCPDAGPSVPPGP